MVDNVSGTSSATSPMFAMSGDGTNDVNIPLLFLFETEGQKLLSAIAHSSSLEVMLSAKLPQLCKFTVWLSSLHIGQILLVNFFLYFRIPDK